MEDLILEALGIPVLTAHKLRVLFLIHQELNIIETS